MSPITIAGCEELLDDPTELYLRQVNPKHLASPGVVGQDAFRPVTADKGKLSGARSTKQTAQGAHIERNSMKAGTTAGTWAVSVQDVAEVEADYQAGLRLIDDFSCLGEGERTIGHTYLDMRECEQMPKNERKVIRDRLAAAANARGCLHRLT